MFNLYFNKIFFLLLIIIFNSIFINSIDVLLLDCPCPRVFHPVCGNDRQTYDNQCLLECSRRYNLSLKFVYEGTCCPNADLCANYFDPVCDQFGNFYANDCIFDFNKCLQHKSGGNLLFIEGRGEQECATAIANAAEKRLQNKKNFNNDNIKRRINNEENINGRKEKNNPCHFFCDETVVPVCDSQFRTHKNRCKFELTVCRLHSRGIFSSLHIVKEGPCRIEENNFAKFPRANSLRRLSPSHLINNGNTQRITNTKRKLPTSVEFSLNSENIKNNKNEVHSPISGSMLSGTNEQLSLKQTFSEQKHQLVQQCDVCKDEKSFDQITPICDNLNRTHRSICLFAQWNCERRSRGEEENVLSHIGECNNSSSIFDLKKEECPNKCSHHFKPVCDNNGITHPNICAYKLYNCLQRKMNGRSVGWLVSLRECTSKQPVTSIECFAEPNCDDETDEGKSQQICDSEGRIHKNTCFFAHAHCLAAKLGKALRIIECPQLKKQQNNNSIITTTLSQFQQISTKIIPKISANFASLPRPLVTTTIKTTLNNQNEVKQKLLDCERRWNDCDDLLKDAYCGSDFKTYRNFCAIQKAQCLDNHVEILFKGECEKCLSNPCLTNPEIIEKENESLFVCDQGGETKSKCEFEVLRCIYEIKFGYNITAAYQGKCCPSIESCTGGPESQPICDSNNNRHSNWCSFEVAKCRSIKIHQKPLDERECIDNNKKQENFEEREEVFRRL